MIIGKTDVKMRTEKVTLEQRTHRLTARDGTVQTLHDERVFASDYAANFPEDKKSEISFASVESLLKKLEHSAEKIGDTEGWLRLRLWLLHVLMKRLLTHAEDDGHMPVRGIYDFILPPAGYSPPANLRRVTGTMAEDGATRGLPADGETEIRTREWLIFEARGKVTTQDGAEIPIDIRLRLCDDRTRLTALAEDFRATLVDPLVINYASDSAQLSDKKFSFDIDADGTADSISMPVNGSAFLALDRNGDGIITDGSELFGVKSGNGFAELAELDDDHNGFIDEGDRVYEQLRLYTKNADGQDVVFTLREKGIQAISLDNIETMLRLPQNTGLLRRTGYVIRSDKTATTVQHIDVRREQGGVLLADTLGIPLTAK